MAGLAPGALGVLAFWGGPADPPWLAVQAGALAGGGLLLLAATLLTRRPQDEPDRGAHFARAASAGLVALPALLATLLGLAPGPRPLLAAVGLLLAASFFAASRRRAPAGGLVGQLGAALAALVGGTALLLLAAGLLASLGVSELQHGTQRRHAILDHDAGVETVALPSCAPRAERVEVLAPMGAHPRLAAAGDELWFDAPGPEGRRQIHRRRKSTGEILCLSCNEPGNNRHAAPNPTGTVVLFDTDRFATWRRPGNTELQLLNASAAERGVQSRRITYWHGPDERPVFAPGRSTLAWSRGEAGRYRVVSSGLVSGHGSLQVGGIGTLWESSAAWVAPLAWSPNARTLAVLRGNPLGPGRVEAVDPATDGEVDLAETATTASSLSFNADGDWYVSATARRTAAAGLLPVGVGFALAPVLASLSDGDGLYFHEETQVFWGPTGEEPRPVDLGESASWGWPTGVALEPDGTGFVLGQQRRGVEGPEERLIAIQLDCS